MSAPELFDAFVSECDLAVSEWSGRLVVRIVGDLDIASRSKYFEAVVARASSFDAADITLDCTELAFVDLQGLDMLLATSLAARGKGRITVLNPPRALQRLLEYTRSQRVFCLVVS